MIFTRNLKEKYNVDVFVAGGGPSGVAAAVACARQGKSVLIAENNGSFGGSGTTGLVPLFARFTDKINFLAGGIGKEIRDAVLSADLDVNSHFTPFKVEVLKRAYDNLVVSAGVKISFFTRVIDVEANNGRIENVILAAKSGIFAVKSKIYIDCTGDGDLSAWAGADIEMGNENGETMPATLCSYWTGIDYSRQGNVEQSSMFDKAFADGVFTYHDRHLPGIAVTDVAHGVGGGNIGHCFGVNATDEISLTNAMLWGRKSALEYQRYYSEYLQGYENMYLCYTADMLGIRESRRIIGDYVLCADDFKSRAVFDDEIGRYAYPVDIHIMKPTDEAFNNYDKEYQTMRYGVGESYGIPYRILTPSKLSNVLCAGRCVSTDRQMQASIRVMPGCYITGQAAGVAAALACVNEDTRSVKISELQQKIVDLGGFVPNRS